jgi:hypothetical protein
LRLEEGKVGFETGGGDKRLMLLLVEEGTALKDGEVTDEVLTPPATRTGRDKGEGGASTLSSLVFQAPCIGDSVAPPPFIEWALLKVDGTAAVRAAAAAAAEVEGVDGT